MLQRDDLHIRLEPEVADAVRELALRLGCSISTIAELALIGHLRWAASDIYVRTVAALTAEEEEAA